MTNDIIRKIHGFVNQVKILPEVKQEYMTFEHFIAMKQRAAAEEAAEETARMVRVEVILDFLQELGEIPAALKGRLQEEADPEKLREWCRLAGKARSLKEFQEQMEEA